MISNGNRHLLRIGDIARLTGKSVRAMHLYEEMGLLRPATRSSGGFRLYEQSAVERVRWIELLHTLGFSLQEMGELVQSWRQADKGPRAMEDLRELFEKKLEETRNAVRRYQDLEKELLEGLSYLETCRECDSPGTTSNGCARCTHDHGIHAEPALVAGIMSASESAAKRRRPAIVRSEEIE